MRGDSHDCATHWTPHSHRVRAPGSVASQLLCPATPKLASGSKSHPIAAPIDAYVRVTADDASVTGLTADDFAVTLDNRAVEEFSLTLPPNQDSAQKVSVVIVVKEDQYRADARHTQALSISWASATSCRS